MEDCLGFQQNWEQSMRGRSKDLQYFTMCFRSRALFGVTRMSIPYSYWFYLEKEKFSCKVTLSLLLAIRVWFFNHSVRCGCPQGFHTHTHANRKYTVLEISVVVCVRGCIFCLSVLPLPCLLSEACSVQVTLVRLDTSDVSSRSSAKVHYLQLSYQ